MRSRELEAGAVIKERKSGMEYLVADHCHYGMDEVTLVARHVIKAGCFDGKEQEQKDSSVFENL